MLFTEIWTRPGDANFGRVIDGPPIASQSYHAQQNGLGDGIMRMPNTFTRFDEILKTDQSTPSNTVRGLVRIFSEADPTTPIGEWLPRSIIPSEDKFDRTVDISGAGMNSVMDWARTEAYDWDGSDKWEPQFPDWIYDGPNVLQNPGFEQLTAIPTTYQLVITATGGTYTLSDGTDTTAALAWNAGDATIEFALEGDIAAIDDVLVTPGDTGEFTIEFVTPPFGVNLTINTGSLTGGSATLTQTQAGSYQPNPWTKSQSISQGTPREFGEYDTFEVSTDQAHSGSRSLKIDPAAVSSDANRYAGGQQVVNVTPGATYQASIWVYPTSSSDEYRFVLRGIDGDLIKTTAAASYTANTWTEVSIADVEVGDRSQIIFRFSNIDPAGNDPSTFYLDDGALKAGQAATTIGQILTDLYNDATSDHAPGRVCWDDDANPGTPWLTLDFTASVDSGGDAWFEQSVSVRLWMRMTYRQVLDQLAATFGIEWQVVPDSVENGTWKLQVFNPGGMGTDYSSAAGPAIQGGSSDVRRSVTRYIPEATNHLVEGEGRVTARRDTSGLEAGIGRIEGSRLDRQAPDVTSAQSGAVEDADSAMTNSAPYVYELVNPQDVPLVAYSIGSRLTIHDPPDVEDTGRFLDVEIVDTPDKTTYECQFFPVTAAGS